jgi:hypothetical protein
VKLAPIRARAERPVPVWRIFLSETGSVVSGARLSKERPHERSSKEPQRNDACQDDDYDQEDAQFRHRRSVPDENLPHFDRRSLFLWCATGGGSQ